MSLYDIIYIRMYITPSCAVTYVQCMHLAHLKVWIVIVLYTVCTPGERLCVDTAHCTTVLWHVVSHASLYLNVAIIVHCKRFFCVWGGGGAWVCVVFMCSCMCASLQAFCDCAIIALQRYGVACKAVGCSSQPPDGCAVEKAARVESMCYHYHSSLLNYVIVWRLGGGGAGEGQLCLFCVELCCNCISEDFDVCIWAN